MNKKTAFLKNTLLGLIVVASAISLLFLIKFGAILGLIAFLNYNDARKEKIIDQKFHQEVAQIPEIKVKSFKLWEGDSIVILDIKNKGEVYLWYGEDGVPRIESLEKYSTSYTCFYVDEKGKKTGYVYDINLGLRKDNAYAKWFPFHVTNLKELVNRYDDIVKIVATFPKDPKTIPFKDSWGTRDVIEKSNPNFVVKESLFWREIWCDLHQ